MSTAKQNLAYWSSEEFLNQYFEELEFNEPYAKTWSSISQGWVTNPWRSRMKKVLFEFIRNYVKKHKKLPKGEFTFVIDWKNKNLHWLVKCLKPNQIVTFPKRLGDNFEKSIYLQKQ